MKISVYPIHSSLSSYQDYISKESKGLLDTLTTLTGHTFEITTDIKTLSTASFALILVQSGGSEGIFKKEIYSSFKGPYYLLTYGASNSLAASLEILTFLRERNEKGEILHGDNNYIAERINSLISRTGSIKEKPVRLGVIGKPSDWLIGSQVDYRKALSIFNIRLVDIPESEIIQAIKKEKGTVPEGTFNTIYNKAQLDSAYQIDVALAKLVKKHHLQGFTLRCFDIIKACSMSACVALALENSKSIIATCEGDVPAMITAFSILKVLGQHAFQANPQWINPQDNIITLAHCTMPLDMPTKYSFDTHFESGIGVGIHGDFLAGDCTIVKISPELNEFYISEGTILENEYRKDRCRSQINIKLDSPVTYFLTSSLGNHHQVIYGHHKKELKEYFQSLGLREIVA
ncbi:MAG: hypothetical protein WCR67_04010 [Bacilli bacterium]